jgi:hypothetical protein
VRTRSAAAGRRLTRWVLGALSLAGPVVFFSVAGSAHTAPGKLVREQKYGFTLRLPAQWNPIPLDGSDITSLLNTATHDDPSLTNALSSQVKSATAQGIKLFAVGPLVGSFVPNLNVIVQSSVAVPGGKGAFLAAVTVQAKISLGEAGITKITSATVHDAMGAVVQVSYTLPLKTGDAHGVQIYAERGSRLVIMTVTTSTPSQSLTDARAIAGSWHWT